MKTKTVVVQSFRAASKNPETSHGASAGRATRYKLVKATQLGAKGAGVAVRNIRGFFGSLFA